MRRLAALSIAVALIGVPAAVARAQGTPAVGTIDVVELAGVLDRPLLAYALDRLDAAERDGARLIVFQMDSVGGVKVAPDGGLPELFTRIRKATVPVAVQIGPRRAHAGGISMFLAAAAHITSIGPSGRVYSPFPIDAGHPGRGRADDEATFVRAAVERGRTPDLNAAFPMGANAALTHGFVDVVTPSLPELFKHANGRTVTLASGPVTVALPEDGVDVRFHQPGPIRRLLHSLADPALLYLLILGAVMLAVFELFQRGFGVAGGTAVLLGVCAIYGITIVPVTLVGGALFLVGAALLTFDVVRNELLWPSWGGLAAFLAGSLLWLPDGQVPLRMSPWLAAFGTIGAFIFFVPTMTFVRRSAMPRTISADVSAALIGGAGMVRSMLNPEGYVMVEGDLWRARSVDGTRVRVGEHVIVSGIEGTTLLVQGAPSDN